VIGMIVGAAIAHNFGLASSPAGVTTAGIGALFRLDCLRFNRFDDAG
jgi:hypothetical protein